MANGFPPGYFPLPEQPAWPADATAAVLTPERLAASLVSPYRPRGANIVEEWTNDRNYAIRPSAGAYIHVWGAAHHQTTEDPGDGSPQASVLTAWFAARLRRIQQALPGAP